MNWPRLITTINPRMECNICQFCCKGWGWQRNPTPVISNCGLALIHFCRSPNDLYMPLVCDQQSLAVKFEAIEDPIGVRFWAEAPYALLSSDRAGKKRHNAKEQSSAVMRLMIPNKAPTCRQVYRIPASRDQPWSNLDQV